MSLSSYLASKYLNAEPPTTSSKKRKRKQRDASSSGLIIADDDVLGWSATQTQDDDDSNNPLTISSSSAEFRKSKKSAWKTVGQPALQATDLDAAAADAIIASAAAENSAAAHLDEEPAIEDDDDGIVKMGDGTHAGLQSAAAVSAQMEKAARAERRRWEAEEKLAGKNGKAKGKEETVYRDATGRRIDISMRRAEARAEAEAALKKEHEEKEAQMGDVQLAAKAARREALEEARFIPVARKADDEEMNRELRERERWNDPATAFLTKKENDGGIGGQVMGAKPVYKGASAPNRYGIRPGYRWDGVDRGNGWEGERFKAMNRSKRNKELDFAWQTDE